MISLDKSKDSVEIVIRDFISQKRARAAAIHSSYGRLLSEMERVIFCGGKRLRPHLVFIGYGSYDDSIARVAAAHELLHAALLVHDDIIDRDILRHGQPTIHHAYNDHYAQLIDEDDRAHFAQSAAILAGDLFISFAYELIGNAKLPEALSHKATLALSRGIFEVAGGELLDTEAPFLLEACDPMTIYRYKTAGYSFIAPLISGAVLSPNNYSNATLELLASYATNLGIAYQIQDDIIGVFGDETVTGKSAKGDLREGKRTLLISNFNELANEAQHLLFEKAFGVQDASEEDFEKLRGAIRDSNALEKTTSTCKQYLDEANAALEQLDDVTLKNNLQEFVKTLTNRAL